MVFIYLFYTIFNFSYWYDTEEGWRMEPKTIIPGEFSLSSRDSSMDHVSLPFLNSL